MRVKIIITLLIGIIVLATCPIWAQETEFDIAKALSSLSDDSVQARRHAAYFLGETGAGKECVQALMDRLDDRDAHVRRIAAHALGKISDARSTDALIELARDVGQPAHVRCSAACSLARLDCSDAFPVLKKMMLTEQGLLQTTARKSLERLAGFDVVAGKN